MNVYTISSWINCGEIMENIVCKMKDEIPVLDFHDCIGYIQRETGYNEDVIMKILDAESDYMMKCVIIEE